MNAIDNLKGLLMELENSRERITQAAALDMFLRINKEMWIIIQDQNGRIGKLEAASKTGGKNET